MVLTHVDLIDKLLAYNSFQKVRRVAAWEAARVPPRAQRQLRARSEQGLGGPAKSLAALRPLPAALPLPAPMPFTRPSRPQRADDVARR